jgi:hypothetical protein
MSFVADASTLVPLKNLQVTGRSQFYFVGYTADKQPVALLTCALLMRKGMKWDHPLPHYLRLHAIQSPGIRHCCALLHSGAAHD